MEERGFYEGEGEFQREKWHLAREREDLKRKIVDLTKKIGEFEGEDAVVTQKLKFGWV